MKRVFFISTVIGLLTLGGCAVSDLPPLVTDAESSSTADSSITRDGDGDLDAQPSGDSAPDERADTTPVASPDDSASGVPQDEDSPESEQPDGDDEDAQVDSGPEETTTSTEDPDHDAITTEDDGAEGPEDDATEEEDTTAEEDATAEETGDTAEAATGDTQPVADDSDVSDGGEAIICNGENDDEPCDDGDLCTTEDVCEAGECVGEPIECDESDAFCLIGSCDPGSGSCTYDLEQDSCYIDNVCYDDGELSPLSGCQRCSPDDAQDSWSSVPDATACTSLDGCVQNAFCTAGMCIGEMIDCDDGDPCTTDSCGEAGCIHVAAEPGTSCDDGNPCTLDDVCATDGCVGVAMDCSDDDACTVDEKCDGGVCVASTLDDGKPCTGANGCEYEGICQQGVCEALTPVCDDGNPCTVDTCTDNICSFEAEADFAACDDGLDCTQTDRCISGTCEGVSIVCDDNDPCTEDSCSEDTGGCTFTQIDNCSSDAAMPFALPDANPYSTTSGEEVTLATYTNQLMVVAFYSPS